MTDEQKGVFLALLTGLAAGFVSKYAGSASGLVAGVIIGYALNLLQKKMFGEKKQGWPAGNVMMPYIFTWLITWIFLVNV
ncbi:MAG: hypothetical protein HYS53_00080 [Candidatus Aenigmarchaeota archaeon]|nr:hypothetical protein [Candidatus Aenigmarchaeota archaeon]